MSRRLRLLLTSFVFLLFSISMAAQAPPSADTYPSTARPASLAPVIQENKPTGHDPELTLVLDTAPPRCDKSAQGGTDAIECFPVRTLKECCLCKNTNYCKTIPLPDAIKNVDTVTQGIILRYLCGIECGKNPTCMGSMGNEQLYTSCTSENPCPEPPKKKVLVDFNYTVDSGKFTMGDGTTANATNSNLSQAAQERAISRAQKEYDTAIMKGGINGIVTIENDVPNATDIFVIVTGGQTPPGYPKNQAHRVIWGHSELTKPAGKGVVVFKGEMDRLTLVDGSDCPTKPEDCKLSNAVGETLAHEVGHRLTMAHNGDPATAKMGDPVSPNQLGAGKREFTDKDITDLKNNFGVNNPRGSSMATANNNELVVIVGDFVQQPPNLPSDLVLDVSATFSGAPGDQFGYISADGEFVFQGDYTNGSSNPAPMSFTYDGPRDIAAHYSDGSNCTLSSGCATFILTNQNPNNSNVYLTAELDFSDGSVLVLNVQKAFNTTGGFSYPLTRN